MRILEVYNEDIGDIIEYNIEIEKKSKELKILHILLKEALSHLQNKIKDREKINVREILDVAAFRRMPYKEYLYTEHWREFRKVALKNAKNKYQLCNKSGKLHVHHRTYENRGCEDINDVTVLCQECHEKHHDIKLTKF